MRSFSSTELANNTGDVLAAAAQAAVEIQRHGKPRFVILSADEFNMLRRRGDTRVVQRVEDLSDTEANELIAELEKAIADDR